MAVEVNKNSRVSADAGVALESTDPGRVPAVGRPITFDFRHPDRFTRELVAGIEELHKGFARRITVELSHALRSVVQVELLAAEQLSYESYVRSLPDPSVLTITALSPLPGRAIMEMDVRLTLLLVDRLLGGPGRPVTMRRPTDLEVVVFRRFMEEFMGAVREAFEPIVELGPEVVGIEFNPQFVHVAPPSETVLLLTYLVTIVGSPRTEGILSLCYPYSSFGSAIEMFERHAWAETAPDSDQEGEGSGLRHHLPQVEVPLSVRFSSARLTARQVADLRPGDVVVFPHWDDEPVFGVIEGAALLEGHLGRRGQYMAFQVSGWRSRW